MTKLPEKIWTIGHSTRGLREFVDLLYANGIEALADVRRFPGSRKYPHFGGDALRASLPAAGITYEHFPELGGRRRPRGDSRNAVWRNESFRGYADYMETAEFQAGTARLLESACARHTAVMCAEAVWWRCHRALLADSLKVRGVTVLHIIGAGKTEVHPYTAAARLVKGSLSYSEGENAKEKAGVTSSK